VFGICKGSTCLRTLPSLDTGIVSTIYNYNENEDSKYTAPSKELASLKWKPVTPEGLLEDLIREGRSTAPITKQDGTTGIAAFENRGMCYMYLTHVGVRVSLATDKDGNPVIPKMMDKDKALQNLVATERRVNKEVYKTYSTLQVYHLSELLNEDAEPMQPFFIALNMSNGAMKSHYNGGYASVSKYYMSILNCKGLKAPLGRTLSEGESTALQAINNLGFYNRVPAWTTIVSMGQKEVQPGTFYSVPSFEGFDLFGSSCYEGKQHETWGDKSGIGSLSVSHLSDSLRARVKYDPATSSVVSQWEKALLDAGFTTPEEFPLSSLKGVGSNPPSYTNVAYTPVRQASDSASNYTAVSNYLVEGDNPDEEIYQ
jgi:hypothetical protein